MVYHTKIYKRDRAVVFLKTKEAFGGLSNMAGGYPLVVNDIQIRTSEALYQACRFPDLPEIQEVIIEQKSPMAAKMKGKPHRGNSRSDWEQVNIDIMRWSLHVKLLQNWETFRKLLLETGDLPIVEASRKDDFWGAKPVDEQTLIGKNILGHLLMELREIDSISKVEPLNISNFMLYGNPINVL